MTLSSTDKNAVNFLKKYGELLQREDGLFTCVRARTGLTSTQIARLKRLGYCRIDSVGRSTFAVFVEKQDVLSNA